MTLRIIGAVCVVLGCGSFGYLLSAAYHREERTLKELLYALDYMQCELQYHLTPLPDLCRQAAAVAKGSVKNILFKLAMELEDHISADAGICMSHALADAKDIPESITEILTMLGKTMGRFDLEGQIMGMEAVRQACRKNIDTMAANKSVKVRCYQTLGLCAGAAIAILFV